MLDEASGAWLIFSCSGGGPACFGRIDPSPLVYVCNVGKFLLSLSSCQSEWVWTCLYQCYSELCS
jgi:hypothetical protein